jgi:hypothetical protein
MIHLNVPNWHEEGVFQHNQHLNCVLTSVPSFLFVVDFTSASKVIMINFTMIDELERIWKEAVVI